jgi:hypothetical protein
MSLSLDFALFMRNSQTKLNLSLSERAVAFSLAFRVGSNAKTWVKQNQLALECGIKERWLREHLNALTGSGIVIVSKNKEDKRKNSYAFSAAIINYHQMTDDQKKSVHDRFKDKYCPIKSSRPKTTGSIPPVVSQDTGSIPPVNTGSIPPVSSKPNHAQDIECITIKDVNNFPKVKEERNNKSKEPYIGQPSVDPDGNKPNHFEHFWERYPRKVKKKKAEQIWNKQKLDTKSEQILSNIKRRNETEWQGRDLQYIPHPTTYLNNEQWNDEILEKSNDRRENSVTRSIRDGLKRIRELQEKEISVNRSYPTEDTTTLDRAALCPF